MPMREPPVSIAPRRQSAYDRIDRLLRGVERLSAKVEHIDRIDSELRQLGHKIEAQSTEQDRSSKILADLATVGHVSKWAVRVLLPMLIGAGVTLVQGYQRQKQVEKELELYRQRIGQIDHDTGIIRSDIRVMSTEDDARDKDIDAIRAALKRIEDEGIKIKRKR